MAESAPSAGRRRSLRVLLVLLLTVTMGAVTAAPLSAQESPLEPLDNSSPRATIESFIAQSERIETATLEAFDDRSAASRQRVEDELARLEVLFDLSEVADTAQRATLSLSFVSLADILLRVPLPPVASIPDEDEVDDEDLTFWILPGTEITLVQLEDSLPPGAWVFSSETVAELPGWRAEVEGEPVLPTDREITDWRALDTQFVGPLVPLALVEALPGWVSTPVLGTPLWKVAAGGLVLLAVLVLVAAWHRLIGSRGRPGTVTGYLFGASTPVVLLVLTGLGRGYMDDQINVSGEFAQVVQFSSSAISVVGLAWLGWVLVRLVAEWIIATPALAGERYDENLIRLSSRFVSLLVAIGILLVGADSLGIPALGVLAGLGVGGLVAGLAAQSTVENVLGGFTIFADKPFRVGDMVNFAGILGRVERIGQRSTRVRKLDGTLLNVPNSDIVKATVTNYTERRNSLFLHTIGVRYETTIEQLQTLLDELKRRIRERPTVIVDSELPRATVSGFGDSSIDIEIRAYIDTASYHEFMLAQQDLLLTIYQVVDDVGTAIAFPSTTAYVTEDPGLPPAATVPSDAATTTDGDARP